MLGDKYNYVWFYKETFEVLEWYNQRQTGTIFRHAYLENGGSDFRMSLWGNQYRKQHIRVWGLFSQEKTKIISLRCMLIYMHWKIHTGPECCQNIFMTWNCSKNSPWRMLHLSLSPLEQVSVGDVLGKPAWRKHLPSISALKTDVGNDSEKVLMHVGLKWVVGCTHMDPAHNIPTFCILNTKVWKGILMAFSRSQPGLTRRLLNMFDMQRLKWIPLVPVKGVGTWFLFASTHLNSVGF